MRKQSGVGCSPSLKTLSFWPSLQICAGQLVIAGLVAMAIPSDPAAAFTDFQICAAQLVRYAGASPEAASDACSEALLPKDLSRCVVTIAQLTPTLTSDALVACQKVRRPVELGRCVYDITSSTRDSEALRVLDYCRRSLLPTRFAECVTGLSREVDFPAGRVLDRCIAAEEFPRNSNPTFVPPPSSNPTLPSKTPFTAPTQVMPGTSTPVTPAPGTMPINPVRL
jgi:hypothetical protein